MSQQPAPSGTDNQVVALLLRQHRMIRELCAAVTDASPEARRQPFEKLVRLMAVHEAVEEEIVHPYVKRRGDGAPAGVDHRLEEEREAKTRPDALDALGVTDAGFMALFERFQASTLAHTAMEETQRVRRAGCSDARGRAGGHRPGGRRRRDAHIPAG